MNKREKKEIEKCEEFIEEEEEVVIECEEVIEEKKNECERIMEE